MYLERIAGYFSLAAEKSKKFFMELIFITG